MNLNALLDALGYLRFSRRHWVTPETAEPRLAYHYRLAERAAQEAGEGAAFIGSYVYRTSVNDKLAPPRPAVFVVSAANQDQARAIHKRLWNLGDCPFVVVVLPGMVRVYTGFDYSEDNPRRTIIADVTDTLTEELPDPLLPFHADAIDTGRLWKEQAKYLGSDKRVDYRLLTDLEELSRILREEYGLAREVAHALIGKYIYFRYLRDRDILSDPWLAQHSIRPEEVFGRDATPEAFDVLAKALQERFNGDIFPLPATDEGQWRRSGAIPLLARTFYGDSPGGQLVLDFQVYDFSYIPVELLSSIYEQFLKDEGKGEGDGVVYTPEALSDYVLAELEAVHPLTLEHKILDPCCGSGVFLVLAFRRLIDCLWQKEGSRPSADQMKRLLMENIFGVEKDREACHITAFSLVLTLLSHLEPPELHANDAFQFPTLVGDNIFHADFFDTNCPVFQKEMRFDWAVGNPPWSGASRKNPEHQPVLAWIDAAKKTGREVGGLRMDEAFTWRVGDVLKPEGSAGLLVMATSLVNSSSSAYRKEFFRTFCVRRITNLSNFLRILFMGPKGKRAEAPAACIVYQSGESKEGRGPILHFGPFVVNQPPLAVKGSHRRVWTITLYEGDIQEIDYEAAVEDEPCLWKTALYGSYLDRRALSRIRRILPSTLRDVAGRYEWLLSDAPMIRAEGNRNKSTSEFIATPALKKQRLLDSNLLHTNFSVTEDALLPLEEDREFVRKRQGLQGMGLIKAPHIIITAELAVYSDIDFVVSRPKVGIAASPDHKDYLKATTLYLKSSVARYSHFFINPPWGISKDIVMSGTVGAIPFVDLTVEQIQRMARVYDDLAKRELAHNGQYQPLQNVPLELDAEVDKEVEATLNIPESVGSIARELMAVRYQLIKGKIGDTAPMPPNAEQLKEYALQLRLQVDDFTRRHHCITVRAGQGAIIATVEVTRGAEPVEPQLVEDLDATARRILEAVVEQHSQWAYVQRSVRIFDGSRVHIVKAARLLDWTRTQAIQDAADLISEVLDKTTPRYESSASV